MDLRETVALSLVGLTSHKLRTLLTMLGIIFGVAAVIAMLSIGEGAKQESLEQIRRRGRWATLKSVERYSKTAHIVADLAHLEPEVRRIGAEFLASPDAFTAAPTAAVRFC